MYSATLLEPVETIIDRRADTRHVAVMLIAKLSSAHFNIICRIRNISAMGARLETSVYLIPGQLISLELRSDLRTTGQVMWAHNGSAGVQFKTPIDVSRYLVRPESKIDRIKVRAPRYHSSVGAVITADSGRIVCAISDIGLSGVGLAELPDRVSFRQGQMLKFSTEGISQHHASIAWVSGNRAGIKFRQPLKYTELESWLLRYNEHRL